MTWSCVRPELAALTTYASGICPASSSSSLYNNNILYVQIIYIVSINIFYTVNENRLTGQLLHQVSHGGSIVLLQVLLELPVLHLHFIIVRPQLIEHKDPFAYITVYS